MKKTSTILIVDDETIGREILKALLADERYELAFASSGQEALTKAAQLIPDVILLDVMMPEMDGFEVCQRLRADDSLAEVPIIMVTALDDRDSRLRGIELGADEFISKPYDTFELRARLQTLIHLNRYRRLLTEHAKFEWVVAQANEAFLILDHNDHIRYANSQARLYLNLTTAKYELISETFLELVAQQYRCEPQATWRTWLEEAKPAMPRYLVRLETATAHAFWLQVNVMEMSSDSDEKYLVNLRNVTETILAERRRWTFQQQITHKLRTPLFPITEGIRYLKNNRSKLSEGEQNEFLEMAYSGATRLQTEIEEILKYLNVYSEAKAEQAPCHIADIRLIITAVKQLLEIASVNVCQKDIEDIEDTCVSISRQAMELILTELFSNAKKFHPKKSPTLEITISVVSKEVCLQICDDGLTLSPEQLANIWTPYYQGEKNFSGEIQGMGLGLSMVGSLIWEVGGRCHAYNRQDIQGLMIELTLPLQ